MSKNTAKVRALLEARLESLRERLSEMTETLRQPEDDDFEEKAAEYDDDELLERLARAGHAEAKLIEAALKRIEAGTYGTCVACGKRIDERRLRAMPEADRCLDCTRRSVNR